MIPAIAVIIAGLGVLGLFAIGRWADQSVADIPSARRELAKQLRYQPVAVVWAVALLLLARLLVRPDNQVTFAGDMSATAPDWQVLGFSPSANWSEVGPTFAIIPMLVTAVVVYLQVLRGRQVPWRRLPMILPAALLFSVSNSLAEELICRVVIVEGFDGTVSAATTAVVSGLVFGIPHYFGKPGGLVGVLMAGFLGWVMAYSVLTTGGLAWAWLIHFAQDVPIMVFLLFLGASRESTA